MMNLLPQWLLTFVDFVQLLWMAHLNKMNDEGNDEDNINDNDDKQKSDN